MPSQSLSSTALEGLPPWCKCRAWCLMAQNVSGSAVLAAAVPLLPQSAHCGWQSWKMPRKQQPKPGTLLTLVVRDPKHGIVWASGRKVSSIPARPSTEVDQHFSDTEFRLIYFSLNWSGMSMYCSWVAELSLLATETIIKAYMYSDQNDGNSTDKKKVHSDGFIL